MARKPEVPEEDENAQALPEIVPPAADGTVHAEVRMLYAESTDTLRFVKNHQWKTVGATLLTFAGIIAVAVAVDANRALSGKLLAITYLMAAAVILTLLMYQFWMHNELAKIDHMGHYFSSAFQDIRRIKSRRESNLHRYTLLMFQCVVVVLGAIVVHLALNRVVIF